MTASHLLSNPQLDEIGAKCVTIRTRRIARIITANYEAALKPCGNGAAQFALMAVIAKLQPATCSGIGRYHIRPTLTRNHKVIIDKGWVAEATGFGRAKPVRPVAD